MATDPDSDADRKPESEPEPPGVLDPDVSNASPDDSADDLPPASDRREFMQKAGSIVVGGAIVTIPTVAGMVAVFDSVFEESDDGISVRLTVLDALPADGVPRAFKVVADKVDAWTTYKDLPLGMVYLRHSEDGKVEAFNGSCPHAGCAVEYRNTDAAGQHYYCPCHESRFTMGGAIVAGEPKSPAKRGLDSLEVDEAKLASGEVWVRFRKFKAGVAEKIAVS